MGIVVGQRIPYGLIMKLSTTSPTGDRKLDSTLAHLRCLYGRRVAVDRLITSLEDYQKMKTPAGDRRLAMRTAA